MERSERGTLSTSNPEIPHNWPEDVDIRLIQQYNLDPNLVGPRTSTETSRFYENPSNENQLPPISPSFERSSKEKVIVVFEGQHPKKTRRDWHYLTPDQLANTNWNTVNGHHGVILLLLPGRYALETFNLTSTDFPSLEIIGVAPDASQVQLYIDEFDEDEEFGVDLQSRLRLCNLTMINSVYAGLIHANTVEIDGCFIREDSKQCCTLIHAPNYCVLRDSTFTVQGGVVNNASERLVVVNCLFEGCSKNMDEWFLGESYAHSPLFKTEHSTPVIICNSIVDKDCEGHVFSRAKAFSIDDKETKAMLAFMQQMQRLMGVYQQNLIETLTANAAKPIGTTTLVNNRFELAECQACDIVLNPSQRNGISCLPNDRETELKLEEIHKSEFLSNLHKTGLSSLPDCVPASLENCITTFNLQAPYHLDCDWDEYFTYRSSLDKCTKKTKKLYDIVKPQVLTVIRQPCMGSWTPESHLHFSSSLKETVRTFLLCIQRLRNTEAGVWALIPKEIIFQIIQILAQYDCIYPSFFKESVKFTSKHISWEDEDCPRTIELGGVVFPTIANGVWLEFEYRWHERGRATFVECFSYLEFFVRKAGSKEKHKFSLFLRSDETQKSLCYSLISKEDLLLLMDLIFGRSDLNLYWFFQLLYFLGGSEAFATEDWPLEYAQARFRDNLSPEEFEEQCPAEEIVFDSSDDERNNHFF